MPAITEPARALFFYGTLQPGAGTAMAQWVAQRLLRAEPASVPGRLLAIRDGRRWYPALVPGQARVRGTLCMLALKPGDWARLDRYEGREYRRVSRPARTGDGRRISARLYLWHRALPPGAMEITDGDFLAWLGRTRSTAFGIADGILTPRRQEGV